jgi:hypothetical protein
VSIELRFEKQTRLALGALRFVDAASGRTIQDAMRMAAPWLQFFRKPDGRVVVTAADAGPEHMIDVEPMTAAFLPRRFVLKLPGSRKPEDADSVFNPVVVKLYPSPTYPVAGYVTGLRVTVRRDADAKRIGGALVRIVRTEAPAFAEVSMTDVAGEALIPLDSLPPVLPAGLSFTPIVTANLDVLVAADVACFTADADVAEQRGFPLIVDPDGLEARRAALEQPAGAVELKAGRIDPIKVAWKPRP